MKAPIVLAKTCHWCSRQVPPYRTHTLESKQTICDDCLGWHFHAQDMLGGAPPRGCQVCQRSWEILRDSTKNVEVRMYVIPKDGILQLLCRDCCQRYVAKRQDLYKGTEFAKHGLILNGNHHKP
jgi:hypothetical protein